ncbi:hypothetical protein Q1695_007868 [Nippostrongylus brasiliensis]|nr:hypothetical protein Q1695_007868 [Nippostrongylus brasiliensis]
MDDPQLDAEAAEWSTRFLHLRVRGVKSHIYPGKPDRGNGKLPEAVRVGSADAFDRVTTAVLTSTARSSRTSSLTKNSTNTATQQSRYNSNRLPKLKDSKK